jgi:hypothetical protein
MSWYCVGRERLFPPEEYQEHINAIGGLNRFNEPNFLLEWGQTPIEFVQGKDAFGRIGQHATLKHAGIPAWFLSSWKPPECFGTPEFWYTISWDPETNSHTLGDFPWYGLYMPCNFNLFVKRSTGGTPYYDPKTGEVCHTELRVEYDAMPLNHYIIDLIVPNIIKDLDTTDAQRKQAMLNRQIAEYAAQESRVLEIYKDAQPAFGGKAGTYESNRERWMQKVKEKQAGLKLSAEDMRKILGKSRCVN